MLCLFITSTLSFIYACDVSQFTAKCLKISNVVAFYNSPSFVIVKCQQMIKEELNGYVFGQCLGLNGLPNFGFTQYLVGVFLYSAAIKIKQDQKGVT